METFSVKLDGSGKILLPAKVRKQLKLEKGTVVIGRLETEQLILWTRAQALRKAQE
jgi:DNA-binding transcriptional regulator/RsmH inhibitor MraZ